jgi:hypothetical protein
MKAIEIKVTLLTILLGCGASFADTKLSLSDALKDARNSCKISRQVIVDAAPVELNKSSSKAISVCWLEVECTRPGNRTYKFVGGAVCAAKDADSCQELWDCVNQSEGKGTGYGTSDGAYSGSPSTSFTDKHGRTCKYAEPFPRKDPSVFYIAKPSKKGEFFAFCAPALSCDKLTTEAPFDALVCEAGKTVTVEGKQRPTCPEIEICEKNAMQMRPALFSKDKAKPHFSNAAVRSQQPVLGSAGH